MNATETTIIRVPLSDAAIEYAKNYCFFYENASFIIESESVVITHQVIIDPTQSIFWSKN